MFRQRSWSPPWNAVQPDACCGDKALWPVVGPLPHLKQEAVSWRTPVTDADAQNEWPPSATTGPLLVEALWGCSSSQRWMIPEWGEKLSSTQASPSPDIPWRLAVGYETAIRWKNHLGEPATTGLQFWEAEAVPLAPGPLPLNIYSVFVFQQHYPNEAEADWIPPSRTGCWWETSAYLVVWGAWGKSCQNIVDQKTREQASWVNWSSLTFLQEEHAAHSVSRASYRRLLMRLGP